MIKLVSQLRWTCAVLSLGLLAAAARADAQDTLEFSLVVSRHGIRSSLYKDEVMKTLASRPWPKWEVDPGILTPRGGELVAAMGAYYRELYRSEGLLSGDAAKDARLVYIRADNDQRTIETGRRIGSALLGTPAVTVDAFPEGQFDPLFVPLRAKKITADLSLGTAAVLGRIGGDPKILERAYARQFADLKRILYGEGGEPADSPFHTPATVMAGEYDNLIKIEGPVRFALITTESLILEYCDGKPAPEVGWGQVDSSTITELMALHELSFNLTARTFYPAQVQASNLASHILQTLKQAASGSPLSGSLGGPQDKIVLLVGHDTNVANLGGLLGLEWWLMGTQQDPVIPGGALTFELWKHAADGKVYVRIAYVAQSPDQMRNCDKLTLAHPPQRAPIFLPGYSTAGPGFDIPLEAFERAVHAAINPAFVVADTR